MTVVSSPAGAAEECIAYVGDNSYFQGKEGDKYLFHNWSPWPMNEQKNERIYKTLVDKFISSTTQSIVNCHPGVEMIAYSTTSWENMNPERQERFTNNIIDAVKQEIEIRRVNWRILFVFNEKQQAIYKQFLIKLSKLCIDGNWYGHIARPVSSEFSIIS